MIKFYDLVNSYFLLRFICSRSSLSFSITVAYYRSDASIWYGLTHRRVHPHHVSTQTVTLPSSCVSPYSRSTIHIYNVLSFVLPHIQIVSADMVECLTKMTWISDNEQDVQDWPSAEYKTHELTVIFHTCSKSTSQTPVWQRRRDWWSIVTGIILKRLVEVLAVWVGINWDILRRRQWQGATISYRTWGERHSKVKYEIE